jgi:hypothetical protein
MLAYITSSPLFKGKKKKKKKEIDADTLDDLLEEDDSDSDSENRNETTTNTNSYYSPSNAVYLKRECIELKIKVNALEEELASIPTSGKGKETHVEHARKMMEKDAEILKLKQQNEEKEKLLSVYQSVSTSKEEAISMGIDASKLLSFEKTKELQKMCAEARNVRDAYEDELRVVKARWEVSRREKREATYALEMKEKKCNAIESAREALEMDRDEARREMSAMKTELNANASRWRMDVSAWETRCLLAEKKAALLLEQRNIANEQKDIDTEEDESGSEEEEEEEEKGKEKTTSGKRVKTKKWALANATNLQASMEDVNKACEEKIKKELEAASAQVLKSKRELETIELKLGVVEVERDAANKSKKNLQIELEKALARESRVLTCLDSLEMEVTGFAEACAEIGVLDSRVATASKSPSWTWHPEFYDVAAASPVDEEEEEGGEQQQQQQQQRQRGRQNELVQTQGENKANALFRTVIQTVEERFEALERAFQEMMDDKEPKSLADAMRDEVKLAFISARVAEERSKGGGGGDSNNTTSATSEEKNKNAGESKANGADDDGDDDDDDENRRNSYEIEALRSEIRELTETSELLEHELNEQLTESNAKCEELTIQLKSMTLSHANASNERESMSRALEDAKSRLNSEREKVQSLESALKNAQNEGKRQIQKEIERRADQEMEMTFEIETLKRDLASKMDRVAELDGRLKSVAAKYEAAKRESGTSEEISQQARVEIERLQKESKAKLEALRIENEELLEKVEDANVRVHQLLQEIEAMDSASAEASEHVSQAMQAIKNASSREISSLKSKLAEAEAFIEATEGMEDELISTREEMSSMKEHFSRREIELRGRIAELENIIEAVRLGRGRKVGVTPPHSPKPSPRKQFGKIGDQDDEVDDDASENSFYIRTSSKADREQTLSAIKSVDKSLRQARDEFDRVRNARSRRLGFDEKGED